MVNPRARDDTRILPTGSRFVGIQVELGATTVSIERQKQRIRAFMAGERGKNTELAVRTYLKTLGQGKEKILELYARDAILLTPQGPFQGQESIAGYYEEFLRDMLPLLASSYSLLRFDVVGEAAYLNWTAEPSIPTGSDTFLVHEGLIVLHTTHLHLVN